MRIFLCFLGLLILMACQEAAPPPREKAKKPKINYYEQGHEITAIAQAELMKNVKNSLEKGGPRYAIEYCSMHATPLADSISKIFDCEINRISLKPRNPKNAASSPEENILLNSFLEKSLEGTTIKDTLIAYKGKLLYYRPILLGMEACLKCHGQVGSEINEETLSLLDELYPQDKATNYRLGEFRGAWRITFSLPPAKG